MQELLRPWKLVTLAIGPGLLIAGSFVYEAPDWDFPVSVLMALVAYATAPWCMRVMRTARWVTSEEDLGGSLMFAPLSSDGASSNSQAVQ